MSAPLRPDGEYPSLALAARAPPSEREQQLYAAALTRTGVQQRSLPFASQAMREAADALLVHRNSVIHWFPRLNSEVASSSSDDGIDHQVPDTLVGLRELMRGLSESNGLCAEHESVLFQLFIMMCDLPTACTVSAGATTTRVRHVLGLEGLVTTRPDIVAGVAPTCIEVQDSHAGPYVQLDSQAHLLQYVNSIPELIMNASELPTNPWFPWLFVTIRPATSDPGSAHLANMTDMRVGLEVIVKLGYRAQRDINHAEEVSSSISRVYGLQIVGTAWRIVMMLAEGVGSGKYYAAEVWCGSPLLPHSMAEFMGIMKRIFAEGSERRRLINNWLYCLRHEANTRQRSISGITAAHEHRPSKQSLLDSMALRPRRRVPSAPITFAEQGVSQRAAGKRRAEPTGNDGENQAPSRGGQRTVSERVTRDRGHRVDSSSEFGNIRAQRQTADSSVGSLPRPASPFTMAETIAPDYRLEHLPSDAIVPGSLERLNYIMWRTGGSQRRTGVNHRPIVQRPPSETRTETPEYWRHLRNQRLQLNNFVTGPTQEAPAEGSSRPLPILQPRPRRHSSLPPQMPSRSAPATDERDGFYHMSEQLVSAHLLAEEPPNFPRVVPPHRGPPLPRPLTLEQWDGDFSPSTADNMVSVMPAGGSASSDRPASNSTSSFEGMFHADP